METDILSTPEKEIKPSANTPVLEEMLKAGIFVGRNTSKIHPKMRPYIFGTKNHAAIIDVEETLKLSNRAADFLKETVTAGGNLLFVGTTAPAKKTIEETAKRLGYSFVTERWLGGTLTNFKTLSKRISYFKKLKADREAGRLEKYTKKERLDFDRQIAKMSIMFGGLEGMDNLPAVLVVADVNSNITAVNEAKKLKIPVVGIMNTDANPEIINYPVVANDRGKASIDWIMGRLEKAAVEGKEAAMLKIKNVKIDK